MAHLESDIALKVVVPGVPQPLFYASTPETTHVDIGSEVLVEVGRRKACGWVVGKEPLVQVTALLSELSQQATPAIKRRKHRQLGFFSEDSAANSPLTLKPLLAASGAFTEEQLNLFAWMSEYYGCALSDVIENALPRRAAMRGKKDIIEAIAAETSSLFANKRPETLTSAQHTAVEAIVSAISAKRFEPMLLFGVTGSGKTEVYLRAIEATLAQGGSALLVVPEISLTPQLVDQFRARLDVPLAVLHSQVGKGIRWSSWEALLSGRINVAIGARSAVFAPLRDLSLIIVDEEHEHSYKQSDSLRYHGRDVAVMRAKLASCPVVLGSATPSFESLLNATSKRYKLLELPERATSRPVPRIEIVDLGSIKRKEMPTPNISPRLAEAMQNSLARKEQIVILYNRRGFSSYLQCTTCQEVLLCKHCSVALTYHKKKQILLCHYCDARIAPPSRCYFCVNPKTARIEVEDLSEKERESIGALEYRGGGTETVVDELAELFPDARIARMDRDTVTAKDSYRRILGDMKLGQTDILVGTQMIAKGHDLPGVTLVGIIDADVGLHLPDFRSSEKAFQLITQAAGRAGRGTEPGIVIVQTRQPKHPTIVATATGRFKAFARYELEQRKVLNYPPYGRLLRLIISGKTLDQAREAANVAAQHLHQYIREHSASEIAAILGPAPAPHEKLRTWYRFHILVKSSSKKFISELAQDLHRWRISLRATQDTRLAIDVDPVDMM